MTYKKYTLGLLLRLVVLTLGLAAVAFGVSMHQMALLIVGAILSLVIFYKLYKFVTRRFVAMDDFFESVKYNDFSRRFGLGQMQH